MVGNLQILGAIEGEFQWLDRIILFGYFAVLVALGIIASRRIKSAGLAFNTNWNPVIFAYGMIPVAFFVCAFIIPYYRKIRLISVYSFLEERLGGWGRVYASLSFMLYMVGRIAVILYLACLLLSWFIRPFKEGAFGLEAEALTNVNIVTLILIVGIITIAYTLLGGMEAVIWADVMQSVIMLGGIVFAAGYLTYQICRGPDPAIVAAWEAGKFQWTSPVGAPEYSLFKRTILVMIIYAVTENLRNLMADQNYVQKFAACSTDREAKKSVWVATTIFVIITTIFTYIGTALWAYYNGSGKLEAAGITKGDDVFPFYIANELMVGLRGLLIAAIMAAAISTIATAFNCAATIWLEDFHKKYIEPDLSDRASILTLRIVTIIWGILGMGFAILMIRAQSALDVWWKMSGIFGGGILGLFLLSLLKVRLRMWQGIVSIVASVLVIAWGVLIQPDSVLTKVELGAKLFDFLTKTLHIRVFPFDGIITGAVGTVVMMAVAIIFGLSNRFLGKREELIPKSG